MRIANRMTDTFYERALTERCSLFISQITRKMKSKRTFLLRFYMHCSWMLVYLYTFGRLHVIQLGLSMPLKNPVKKKREKAFFIEVCL